MGILDKLRLKKKKVQEPEVKPEAVAAEQEERPKTASIGRVDTGLAYQILIRPVLSEKATHLANSGRYVFAVHPHANKSEIKKSIQKVYDVHVTKVRIVKMSGKKRRYGRTVGETKDWKKAIITVRKGEKIPGIIEAVG